ncbi:MAG TPA: hypothetical protein IAB65_02325 [Candidatus Onthocola stercorigallinarum]|nr:hypothetical protein [Candidatus Onthocola stercorigallinarum]
MKRTSKLTIGIILTLSSIFVIAAIFFGVIIFYSVNQELKIENNLSEIDYLVNYDMFDPRIDDLLNNYVSSGNYLVVEKATKEYLKDILYYARRIDELNDNEEFIMVLSMENFYSDMPEFNDSLRIIADVSLEITDIQDNFVNLLQEDVVLTYLDDNIFSYYKDYYKELIFDADSIEDDALTVESNLDFVLSVLDLYEEFYTFLSDNKDDWIVDGEYIYFSNTDLEEEYLDILYRIENIEYYDNSFNFV